MIVKDFAPITHIHFAPNSKTFVTASSTKVSLYSNVYHSVEKTISRFKGTVYSPHFRQDGSLLVAGDATGLIQVKFFFSKMFFEFIFINKNLRFLM